MMDEKCKNLPSSSFLISHPSSLVPHPSPSCDGMEIAQKMAEEKRMETMRQLAMIGELQRHLLPKQIPQPAGWCVAGYHAQGRWPGGDYYDFLTLPDGRVLIFLADAGDQGAPAIALVAMVRVVLHSCPLSSGVERLPFCPLHEPVLQPPQILLGHLNEILIENSLQEQFMSAFCGVLDPAEGNLHFANAGQPPPRWWHASSGELDTIRDANGLPLGLHRHVAYHHKRIQLESGDLLVLHSEGLTSIPNDRGEIFGSERVEAVVQQAAPSGAEAIKAQLMVELDQFLNGFPSTDDLTFVIVERQI
jgi:sigma-B regulation protein RsbU (phosphoserine phosphatase)